MRFYFIFYIFISISSLADENWNKVRSIGLTAGKTYNISSGTGFFVSSNHIVTNNHVVDQCINISVRGAINPRAAKLIDFDKEKDLALLYTDANAREIANLRSNDNLRPDDILIIIGYPLTHSEDGNSVITNSKIIGNDSNVTQFKQLEFTANIEHGNSGGPLLDSSGNVIGVVQAVKKYYREYNNVPESTPFKITGLAIGLETLRNFLNKNSVYFYLAASADFVNNYNVIHRAKNYIVNIHCVRKDLV